ncbi:hypothetical protein BYT27DRAFT_7341624 [Phlegmacium glaucopus]|nr:hypothetical protein BYT27DRAFT_7341624 [Phlegmacium glaucopus]
MHNPMAGPEAMQYENFYCTPKRGIGTMNMLVRWNLLSFIPHGKRRRAPSFKLSHQTFRAIETKPGSATVPFFGIDTAVLHPVLGQELHGNNVEGVLVLKNPWPSIARTIYQDHKRYLETYMKPYSGLLYTGDGAARDEHGYIWNKGRVYSPSHFYRFLRSDKFLFLLWMLSMSRNIGCSTAEIESALIMHKGAAETAGTTFY